jgi:hypothetical protein
MVREDDPQAAIAAAEGALEASSRRHGHRSIEAGLAARALEHWLGVAEDDASLLARSLPL